MNESGLQALKESVVNKMRKQGHKIPPWHKLEKLGSVAFFPPCKQCGISVWSWCQAYGKPACKQKEAGTI